MATGGQANSMSVVYEDGTPLLSMSELSRRGFPSSAMIFGLMITLGYAGALAFGW